MTVPFQSLFNTTYCMKTVVHDLSWNLPEKVYDDIYELMEALEHTDMYACYGVSKVIQDFRKLITHIEIVPLENQETEKL